MIFESSRERKGKTRIWKYKIEKFEIHRASDYTGDFYGFAGFFLSFTLCTRIGCLVQSVEQGYIVRKGRERESRERREPALQINVSLFRSEHFVKGWFIAIYLATRLFIGRSPAASIVPLIMQRRYGSYSRPEANNNLLFLFLFFFFSAGSFSSSSSSSSSRAAGAKYW